MQHPTARRTLLPRKSCHCTPLQETLTGCHRTESKFFPWLSKPHRTCLTACSDLISRSQLHLLQLPLTHLMALPSLFPLDRTFFSRSVLHFLCLGWIFLLDSPPALCLWKLVLVDSMHRFSSPLAAIQWPMWVTSRKRQERGQGIALYSLPDGYFSSQVLQRNRTSRIYREIKKELYYEGLAHVILETKTSHNPPL